MALDYDRLIGWPFDDVTHAYTGADCMLYALSVGMGSDPCDPRQLAYVYEKDLVAFPTLPIVLGMGDMGFLTDPQIGIDLTRLLHGSTAFELHRLPAPGGAVRSRMAIDSVIDKGPDKGAILNFSRRIHDAASDALVAVERGAFMLRGNGGFGGPVSPGAPAASVPQIPERPCDASCDIATLPQSALLYRLTGDRNPLHADPQVARHAGFTRPILHGSCTYGVIAHALVKTWCDYIGERMRRLDLRFTAPVYPGETLRTEMWLEAPGLVHFRARVVERDVMVANGGLFAFAQ